MMDEIQMQDMKKRLYTIALFGKLTSQIRTKSTTLARYGFETLDQQILLCFFTLRFIMEKTLQSETCFLEDIALFLLEANQDLFHRPLLIDECRSLGLVILSDIIGNAGEPVVFEPFEKAPELRVSLQYIDSRLVSGPSGSLDVSYQMVDDGFHLMLSTLEMEENMRLQFRDLVFQMQLKARNYTKALDEIRQIFQLLRIRETEIEQEQITLRSNAASLDPDQYRKLNEDTLSLMSDSRKKFEGYREEVASRQEGLRQMLESGVEEDDSSLQQLADLGQIESWLSRSVLSLERIINLLMALSITYDQELKDQLIYAAARRRSFSQTIYKEIQKNANLLDGFDRFVRPLFFRDLPRSLNLSLAGRYRQLQGAEEDGMLEEIDSQWDEQAEEKRRLKLRQEAEMFDRTVTEMMERLLRSANRTLPLSEMCRNVMEEGTADQFKQLLCGFASAARLDLKDLQEQASLMIEDERTSFSLPLSLLSAMDQLPALREIRWLLSSKQDRTFERVFEEDGVQMTLSCSDLLFSLCMELPAQSGTESLSEE